MNFPQARAIAAVVGAVTLLPVHAVLIDAPITNTRDSGVRNGGTTSDHLPPATIPWGRNGNQLYFLHYCLLPTDKSTRTLLYHLHAKGSWHVTLIAVALDGNVLRAIESFIGTAAVVAFAILVRGALVASNGQAACKCPIN